LFVVGEIVGKLINAMLSGLWWLVRKVFDLFKKLLRGILGGIFGGVKEYYSPDNYGRRLYVKQLRKSYERAGLPPFLVSWYVFKDARKYYREQEERKRKDIEEGRERPPR
jgi:hypothetical protein